MAQMKYLKTYLDENEDAKEEYEENHKKLENDPRITKVGKFLKKNKYR